MVDIAVDAALSAGYRHFDTAKYYLNEPELGNALQVILTFKIFYAILEVFA